MTETRAAYHKEVKTASFQGKSITVENLTPVLSPKARDKRKREIESCLYEVFVKYAPGRKGRFQYGAVSVHQTKEVGRFAVFAFRFEDVGEDAPDAGNEHGLLKNGPFLSDGQPAEPFAVLEDIGIDFLKNGLRIHGFRRVLGEDGFAEAAVPGREAAEESGEQAAQTDDTEHGKPLGEQCAVWGGNVRFEKRRRQQASGCSGKERPKAQDEVKPVFPEAGHTSPECCGMFQFVTHGVAIQEPHGIVNLGMAYGSMATTCRWKEKRGRGTPCPLFLPPIRQAPG